MRLRWCCSIVLLLGLLLSTLPVEAAVIPVDPGKPPRTTASKADFEKMVKLQSASIPIPLSEVSPDDKAVFAAFVGASQLRLGFLNVQDGSFTAVRYEEGFLPFLTSAAWVDSQTLIYLSVQDRAPIAVTVDRRSGSVKTAPVRLPGFPVSLSPDGRRLLLVTTSQSSGNANESEDDFERQAYQQDPLKSPFELEIKRRFGGKSSLLPYKDTLAQLGKLAHLEAEDDTLKISAVTINIASLDLRSGKLTRLLSSPAGTAITSVGWARDSSRLALIRQVVPIIGRQGNLLSDVANADALGQLPPKDNPFFQSNVVDTVDFNSGRVRPQQLVAAAGNGDFFGRADWSTDGKTLMTQMYVPGRLAGRAHPTYVNQERSYLRFYNADGKLLNTFENAEIDAPFQSQPVFVSPDEVLINSARGTNYNIYYYNRANGVFRRLATDDGAATSMLATRQSRQVIFSFNAFTRPPEMYRLSWQSGSPQRLTSLNEEVRKLSKTRADKVSFTLANGQTREGYVVQPATASFPPRNTRMLFWQEGGPGPAMVNQWGANVESPFALLPNFGFSILVVPLSGRVGFGPAFYNALAENRNFGQIDIDEGAEIVRQSFDRGYTAPGSMGVVGCSYGGYFASQSIQRHPDLYAAANSQCTLLDLFHEWQFGFTPVLSYLMGRTPIIDPQEYASDSPLYNAAKIKTPLLLFHGTNDFLPVRITNNFHDQVQANGTAVNMMQFSRNGHGLQNPVSQIIAAQAQVRWFEQYLAKPASPVPAGIK